MYEWTHRKPEFSSSFYQCFLQCRNFSLHLSIFGCYIHQFSFGNTLHHFRLNYKFASSLDYVSIAYLSNLSQLVYELEFWCRARQDFQGINLNLINRLICSTHFARAHKVKRPFSMRMLFLILVQLGTIKWIFSLGLFLSLAFGYHSIHFRFVRILWAMRAFCASLPKHSESKAFINSKNEIGSIKHQSHWSLNQDVLLHSEWYISVSFISV